LGEFGANLTCFYLGYFETKLKPQSLALLVEFGQNKFGKKEGRLVVIYYFGFSWAILAYFQISSFHLNSVTPFLVIRIAAWFSKALFLKYSVDEP
jgi:hypothetical protein